MDVEGAEHVENTEAGIAEDQKMSLEDERKRMEQYAQSTPLQPQAWLNWIKKESDASSSISVAAPVILPLFRKGLMDFYSTELWSEYVKVLAECDEETLSSLGLDFDTVISDAIVACSNDVSNGNLVWEIILKAIVSHPSNRGRTDEQVNTLFLRALSLPFRNSDDIVKLCQEWGKMENINEQTVLRRKADLEARLDHETQIDALQTTGSPAQAQVQAQAAVKVFSEYAKFEVARKEPSRAKCVFERGAVYCGRLPEFWSAYIAFWNIEFPQLRVNNEEFTRVVRNAVRNCYYVAKFWNEYVLCLEDETSVVVVQNVLQPVSQIASSCRGESVGQNQISDTDIVSIFETVLFSIHRKAQMEIARSVSTANVLHSGEGVVWAFEQITKLLGEFSPPFSSFALSSLSEVALLIISGEIGDEMEKVAHSLVKSCLKGRRSDPSVWISVISIMWRAGDIDICRKLFKEAYFAVDQSSASLSTISREWIRFESLNGGVGELRGIQSAISKRTPRAPRATNSTANTTTGPLRSMDGGGRGTRGNARNKLIPSQTESHQHQHQHATAFPSDFAQIPATPAAAAAADIPPREDVEMAAPMGGASSSSSQKQQQQQQQISTAATFDRKRGAPSYSDHHHPYHKTTKAWAHGRPHERHTPSKPPFRRQHDHHRAGLGEANPHSQPPQVQATPPPDYSKSESRTVFVSNLPYSMTSDDFKSWLEDPSRLGKGGVAEGGVRLALRPHSTFNRGFGYVELVEESLVTKCVGFSKQEFHGREIVMEVSRSKQAREAKESGGRVVGDDQEKFEWQKRAQEKKQSQLQSFMPRAVRMHSMHVDIEGKNEQVQKGDVDTKQSGPPAAMSNEDFRSLIG